MFKINILINIYYITTQSNSEIIKTYPDNSDILIFETGSNRKFKKIQFNKQDLSFSSSFYESSIEFNNKNIVFINNPLNEYINNKSTLLNNPALINKKERIYPIENPKYHLEESFNSKQVKLIPFNKNKDLFYERTLEKEKDEMGISQILLAISGSLLIYFMGWSLRMYMKPRVD